MNDCHYFDLWEWTVHQNPVINVLMGVFLFALLKHTLFK